MADPNYSRPRSHERDVLSTTAGDNTMKFYSSDLSPFGSRVRMLGYVKGLALEQEEAPGGPGSDEFTKINPLGKIPALILDGDILPESEVICEYLEERFPSPALMPEGTEERARVRLLSRIADLYLLGPVFALIPHMNPAERDQTVVDAQLVLVTKGLESLEHHIDEKGDYAIGSQISLADCALVPAFFFLTGMLAGMFGVDVFGGRPRIERWWQLIGKNEHAARILEEMAVAMKERMAGNG